MNMMFNTDPEETKKSLQSVNIVAGQDGLYEVRQNAVGTFVGKKETVPSLKPIKEGAQFNLSLIPASFLLEACAHFWDCYQKGIEGRYQIFWDNKDYFGYIPESRATATKLETFRNVDLELKFPMVVDIHSHLSKTVVFSKTDDENELEGGKFYLVVGIAGGYQNQPPMRMRYYSGRYVYLSPWVVFENPWEG